MEVKFGAINKAQNTTNFGRKHQHFEQKSDSVELNNKKEKVKFRTKVKNFFSKYKTIVASLVSSLLTGGFVLFATNKNRSKLVKKNKDLETQKRNLYYENSSLKTANSELQEQNAILKQNQEELQNKLNNVVLSTNLKEEVQRKKEQLNAQQLSYSPMEPTIVVPRYGKPVNKNPVIDMEKIYERPMTRCDAKQLEYPDFVEGQPYEFEFPMTDRVKVTKELSNVEPISRKLTTVSASYSDSLKWPNDKIARDLLQNFYDGHGQTLDGVKFNVTPDENGEYKVRIEGKSIFTPEKAILLGETTKRNDSKAAGNYGEGLKMVVLKLLKEKGAKEVDIASGNWKVNWQLANGDLGKQVLSYQLDKIPEIDGNYIEFKTNNKAFINSIISTFDRFDHTNNMAFSDPDFENDLIGVKLLNKDEKGGIYMAGQAFQYDGKFENLDGMNIYIKEKPSIGGFDEIFDPSRDRISLHSANLEKIGFCIVDKDNMSKEDAVKLLYTLQEYWDVDGSSDSSRKYKDINSLTFVKGVINGLAQRGDLNIKFPNEKDLACSYGVSPELHQEYEQRGFRLCNYNLSAIGMPDIKEKVYLDRKHIPLEPTETEKNKILILKEAIKLLEPTLSFHYLFDEAELDTKIHIFDKNSPNESEVYKNTKAEAIIDDSKSKGFWIDRNYLSKCSFSAAVSTALHELAHKFGGDESANFSYHLTDVLKYVLETINKNPEMAGKFKVLDELWKTQK